jgi:hypothetical protein
MNTQTEFSDGKLPLFLYGTFDWRIHGFHFDSPPPIDLLTPESLESTNPWVVLASVLEHAKSGDHSYAKHLSKFFHAKQPFALNRISLLLVGDIGDDTDLLLIAKAMESNDEEVRLHAAKAAKLAGRLWLIPAMLSAWKQAYSLDDREGIGYAISTLLESKLDAIADQASIYRLPNEPPLNSSNLLKEYWQNRVANDDTEELFPALVMEAYNRILEKLGTVRVTVWRGELFSVTEFAKEFLLKIQSGSTGDLFTYRHKFEANTGLNCNDFFVDIKPNLLSMQAKLEDFLITNPETKFKPGVRYFFGHRIPD